MGKVDKGVLIKPELRNDSSCVFINPPELLKRGVSAEGSVDEKRKLLSACLKYEKYVNTTNVTLLLDEKEQLAICTTKLESIAEEFRSLALPLADKTVRRLRTRLIHVHGRLELLGDSETKKRLAIRCLKTVDELEAEEVSNSDEERQHGHGQGREPPLRSRSPAPIPTEPLPDIFLARNAL
ncbi:hypothetical protein FQA39_LY17095 [Lamprigera yunnana]|nr:hypothetical protein FQA39_LY17095 [Lamprigera yunnana]